MTIHEGNKLIAEFMGMKVVESYIDAAFNNDLWCVFELKYHTSWDYLMPVVEKIESLGYNTDIVWYVGDNNALIHEGTPQGDGGKYTKYIVDIIANTKKEAVWQAVVSFIQWHNEQTATKQITTNA